MFVELSKQFSFEAAHRLPCVPAGHKCGRLHGHSFNFEIRIRGAVDPGVGWLMDYAEIKAAVAPLIETLDHSFLNEIEGLSNPTSENLAIWIWTYLIKPLPAMVEVLVRETCSSGCSYRGETPALPKL